MSEKVLPVPYITQPTSITCQSTCLKMFGLFLANRMPFPPPVRAMTVQDIWKEINESEDRPSSTRNSYQNMVWWLGKYFPGHDFEVSSTKNTGEATGKVVHYINQNYPIMVSTNHARTSGHIILVIGYRNHFLDQSSSVQFICHDPYGKFDPQLGSLKYGMRRYDGGMSLLDGGEIGPGKSVVYDYQGIQRIRSDKHSTGTYYMISAGR